MSSKSDDVAKSLLSRAHSPTSTARILTEKIKNRPLLLKPTEPSNARHQRQLHRLQLKKRRRKLKPQPLSAREKRATRIYEIPKAELKYEIYEPLNRLWTSYITEVLGGNCMPAVVGSDTAAKLASADFHGAELEVVRSRCVSRVGARGIVVRDSKFAFRIVTRENALKTIPKEHTIFRFEIPLPRREGPDGVVGGREGEGEGEGDGREEAGRKKWVFELLGDQFQHRAADRANKKFKSHFLRDL